MTTSAGTRSIALNRVSKHDQASPSTGKLLRRRRNPLVPKRLAEHLPDLEAKAARLREKELRARRKAEKIERQIQGIRLLVGLPRDVRPFSGVSHDRGSTPTGVSAIRRLLTEDPSRVWSAGSLHAELEARGWFSPTARHPLQGTEAALSRLVRRGELTRLRRGQYALVGDSLPETRRVGDPTRAARGTGERIFL